MLTEDTQTENQELIEIINSYVSTNGPNKEDYQKLNLSIEKLGQRIVENKIDKSKLHDLIKQADFLTNKNSIMGHILQKPYGYAGDFSIIDRIYTYDFSDQFRKWDDYSLTNSAAQAVRNRKTYFKKLVTNRLPGEGKLLNIASGPGRDLFEYYSENKNTNVLTTCVEIDKEAISHATLLNKEFLSSITFVNKNILLYKAESKFDLIWSAGLFDYFDDRQFVFVLKSISRWLQPGGEIVIGNFNQDNNPSRLYMELFGEWFLNHRTSEQLINLAEAAGFRREHISVGREPENVNLFLHLTYN
ncbi:MAG TPA: class I SAM-dependent methyltransferase [Phormidium sp.]